MHAIQNYIFENPSVFINSNKNPNMLFIGLSKNSSIFIDNIIQCMQLPGKHININILCTEREKNKYLSARPAMPDFFNVNGSQKSDPENYGNIFFHNDLTETEELKNKVKAPDFIFIDKGKTENYDTAVYYSKVFPSCPVISFACYERSKEISPGNIIPVYVSDNVKNPEIERMALNTHLIWNRHFNLDFKKIMEEFRMKYNHDSCVCFVLSIRFRLLNIDGIDDLNDIHGVIEKYKKYISDDTYKNNLICYEHKRWVTHMICLGCQRADVQECVRNRSTKIKDKNGNVIRHVCLVKSTRKRRLAVPPWMVSGRANMNTWNAPPESSYNALDPLEKVSVDLHNAYRTAYDNSGTKSDFLHGNIVNEITKLIKNDFKSLCAFRTFQACIKNIYDCFLNSSRSSNQWKRYKGLKHSLENQINCSDIITPSERSAAVSLINALDLEFFNIYESFKCIDYKNEDVKLVEGIPFILTYNSSVAMVIPFIPAENNDSLFRNVAAATAVNPETIIFVSYFDDLSEAALIKRKLPYINDYIDKKNIRSSVHFFIGCEYELDKAELKKNFTEQSSAVKKITVHSEITDSEFYDKLRKQLLKIQEKGRALIIEKNCSPVSAAMSIAGFHRQFPSFSYKPSEKIFRSENCELTQNLTAQPFFTVNEMFTFTSTVSLSDNTPEFIDYDAMYKIFSEYNEEWKFICKVLENYHETNDIIETFSILPGKSGNETADFETVIPASCMNTAGDIIRTLISIELIRDTSFIKNINSDTCKLKISCRCGYKDKFTKLFSNLDFLSGGHCLIKTDPQNYTAVIYQNNLHVRNADFGKLFDNGFKIFSYLSKNKYITNYTEHNKKVSFNYASGKIKDILTLEGKMLEIYVYHKINETGKFDDVRSGYEIIWKEHTASNEIDVIATRGLKSIFIECKSTMLKRSFYDKLHNLVNELGVNAKAVIVTDNDDDSYESRQTNKYGQVLSKPVITVRGNKNIENIGNILYDIIEGEYTE